MTPLKLFKLFNFSPYGQSKQLFLHSQIINREICEINETFNNQKGKPVAILLLKKLVFHNSLLTATYHTFNANQYSKP